MSIPVGSWTLFSFGPAGALQGTLSIFTSGSSASGNLTTGGNTQPLSVLWDESAQEITFTTVVVPVAAPFEVYEGNAFQPFPATQPPIFLAGTFRTYSPAGPAGAASQFDWYAVAAPKPKEKEKEKEKEHKDKEKEHKDKDKDNLKEKEKDVQKELEKLPENKLPELRLGSGETDQATLQMLEQRIAVLEQQLAAGKAFIKPEERPAVGEEALKPHKDKGKG